MESTGEPSVLHSMPVILQRTTYDASSQSTDSLGSTAYSDSPLIFGNSLPWALATFDLEHRLRTEEDPCDDDVPESPIKSPEDSACTANMPLLSHDLRSVCHVESFVHPTHVTTRTVIRPVNSKCNHPLVFLRSAPTRNASVFSSNSAAVRRPASPVPRPVSPLTGTLKALNLITDATLFEEDLDYYEYRWMMEQAGQGSVEIRVAKHRKITIEYMYDNREEEDEVVYPRGRVPGLFGPSVFTRN